VLLGRHPNNPTSIVLELLLTPVIVNIVHSTTRPYQPFACQHEYHPFDKPNKSIDVSRDGAVIQIFFILYLSHYSSIFKYNFNFI